MEEIWLDVEGFPNYQVSNIGSVKSLPRLETWGRFTRTRKGTFFKPQIHRDGYLKVGIRAFGKFYSKQVHRLVALAFIPNPLNLPQVNHIDGNKQNNKVTNLEWMTSKDNCIHAVENSLYEAARGEKTNRSHLKEGDVLEIRRLYPIISNYCQIARMFNISEASTRDIIFRKTWKHI